MSRRYDDTERVIQILKYGDVTDFTSLLENNQGLINQTYCFCDQAYAGRRPTRHSATGSRRTSLKRNKRPNGTNTSHALVDEPDGANDHDKESSDQNNQSVFVTLDDGEDDNSESISLKKLVLSEKEDEVLSSDEQDKALLDQETALNEALRNSGDSRVSIIHLLSKWDQIEKLKVLYNKAALKGEEKHLLTAQTTHGLDAIHFASMYGSVKVLEFFLKTRLFFLGPEKSQLWTPLHYAAYNGHTDCVKILCDFMKKPKQINAQNLLGNTALHLASKYSQDDCVKAILEYGIGVDINILNTVHQTALHLAGSVSVAKILLDYQADPLKQTECGSPLENFIVRLPSAAKEVFSRYITSNQKSMDALDLQIVVDLKPFQPKDTKMSISTSVLMNIIQANQSELLKHPLCETYINVKWAKVRRFFIFTYIFHVLFALSITLLSLVDYSPIFEHYRHLINVSQTGNNSEDGHGDVQDNFVVKNDLRPFALYLTAIFLCLIFLLDMLQALFQNPHAFFISRESFLKLLTLGTTFMFLVFGPDHNLEHLAAIAVFLAWLNITVLSGKIPAIGIYIYLFIKVAVKLFLFFIVYLSALLGFIFSFHILLSRQTAFNNPIDSMLKILAMMVGEFDFVDNFTISQVVFQGTTQIFFVLFLFIVAVVVANLLTGLAINDVSTLLKDAGIFRLEKTVLLLDFYENLLHSKLGKQFRLNEVMKVRRMTDVFTDISHTLDKNGIKESSNENPNRYSATRLCFFPNALNDPYVRYTGYFQDKTIRYNLFVLDNSGGKNNPRTAYFINLWIRDHAITCLQERDAKSNFIESSRLTKPFHIYEDVLLPPLTAKKGHSRTGSSQSTRSQNISVIPTPSPSALINCHPEKLVDESSEIGQLIVQMRLFRSQLSEMQSKIDKAVDHVYAPK